MTTSVQKHAGRSLFGRHLVGHHENRAKPELAAMSASPAPVLPEVASTMVPARLRAPLFFGGIHYKKSDPVFDAAGG